MFGGVLRELAMFGRRGFRSDIDIVVDGDWEQVERYLQCIAAKQNRFGGYRLDIGTWPVDIWAARDTWAIRQGLVRFQGIESLLGTTILNWDAILMDWRTKQIICGSTYFRDIRERIMDIVLEENPNPLGAAVRAFRHFCMKDAQRITCSAARYLSSVAKKYTPSRIREWEQTRCSECHIDMDVLVFFHRLNTSSDALVRKQFEEGEKPFQQQLF